MRQAKTQISLGCRISAFVGRSVSRLGSPYFFQMDSVNSDQTAYKQADMGLCWVPGYILFMLASLSKTTADTQAIMSIR